MGDKGDNIPAIAPRVGSANAIKIYKNLDEELKNPIKNQNFERNKVLIDFDCIPLDVIELMKKTWSEYETTEFKARDLMNFFAKHKINGLVENIHEIINNFKPLI
jgi:5'-3' exonuclease